jgi:hypothetical protein
VFRTSQELHSEEQDMTLLPFRRANQQAELPMPAGRWHERIWVSEKSLNEPDQYREFVAAHESSKLWPVLIPHDQRFATSGRDWIDDRSRLPPAGGEIAGEDAGATLAEWWGEPCCDGNCLEPFGADFPGLARRSSARTDRLFQAGQIGGLFTLLENCRLGLVRAERPADVPALLGWAGMLNTTDRLAAISAVLRSWEDRFGATLIGLGFDELTLSVAAPPTGTERAVKIAAEHRSFCRQNFTKQRGNLRDFAKDLIDRQFWRFSWP